MNFLSVFKKKPIFESKINGKLVIGTQMGEKAVFGGGVTQSGGELVPMWEELISSLQKSGLKVSDFLLLGVGAGMVIHIARKHYPKAKLVGVDLDPVIVDIGKQEFGLEKDKAELLIADAISWIASSKRKFDLIAIDLYVGRYNAPGTREEDFLKNLKRIVRKNGVILYNSHFKAKEPQEYKEFRKLCLTHFKRVEEVFSYPINRVLLLSN